MLEQMRDAIVQRAATLIQVSTGLGPERKLRAMRIAVEFDNRLRRLEKQGDMILRKLEEMIDDAKEE